MMPQVRVYALSINHRRDLEIQQDPPIFYLIFFSPYLNTPLVAYYIPICLGLIGTVH